MIRSAARTAATFALLGLSCAPRTALAQERPEEHAHGRPNRVFVGVGAEHFGKTVESFGHGQDFLFGPTIAFRRGPVEPHFELLATPFAGTYENWRLLASLGARTYIPLGRTEISIGGSLHAEARLQDHYALLSFTPVEIGVTLYRKGTLQAQIFTGIRAGFAGALIDSYLLDPNGFRDEEAQSRLDEVSLRSPWKVFARLVFSRRVH